MEYWYIVLRVDIYSLIYNNTMAKIAMKDRKTVSIAEKPPPPPPPPEGGCGVTGLGWCVSIMQSVSQSVWKASRNFRVSRGIWCLVALGRFAWCDRLAYFLWRSFELYYAHYFWHTNRTSLLGWSFNKYMYLWGCKKQKLGFKSLRRSFTYIYIYTHI